MNFVFKLIILLAILIIIACSKNHKEISLFIDFYLVVDIIQAYNDGVNAFEVGDECFAGR